jgi:hypothetical protein
MTPPAAPHLLPALQEFKTVMAALKSNNARWGILDVTLVLRRPADDAEAALCVKKQEAAQP